jgi:hypothetical protein
MLIVWTNVFAKDEPVGGNFVTRWSEMSAQISVVPRP